jgi:PilZ domain
MKSQMLKHCRGSQKERLEMATTIRQQELSTNGRRHMRYPVRACITYRWRDCQGVERRGRGWTQNISEGGALVSSSSCPGVGDLVDLKLKVPTSRAQATGSSLRMEMNASVVRVLIEAEKGRNWGFAVRRRAPVPGTEENSEPTSIWQCREMFGFRTN